MTKYLNAHQHGNNEEIIPCDWSCNTAASFNWWHMWTQMHKSMWFPRTTFSDRIILILS